MADDETARELEKLRADVAALSETRREETARPAEEEAAIELEPTVVEKAASETLPEDQKTQLEELGELLQAEIRDLPTVTCLAVFSLGILMGRLMR